MAASANSITFEEDIAADTNANEVIDDIFGDDDDDDPFKVPAPLASLPIDDDLLGLNEIKMGQDGGNAATSSAEKKKATKKRSPHPRLNDTRLCSDRGIPALLHICDDIKFKGKGHETSDVKLLLQRFEHWAHRLYPKFPFENVVEQAESLSKKKLVQNAIKRARRGEEEEVADNNSSDEEANVNGISVPSSTPSMTNANFGAQPEIPATPSIGLTPEQLERMRQNRLKALEKRKLVHEQAAQITHTEAQEQDDNGMPGAADVHVASENNRTDDTDDNSSPKQHDDTDMGDGMEKNTTNSELDIDTDGFIPELSGQREDDPIIPNPGNTERELLDHTDSSPESPNKTDSSVTKPYGNDVEVSENVSQKGLSNDAVGESLSTVATSVEEPCAIDEIEDGPQIPDNVMNDADVTENVVKKGLSNDTVEESSCTSVEEPCATDEAEGGPQIPDDAKDDQVMINADECQSTGNTMDQATHEDEAMDTLEEGLPACEQ